MQTDEIMFMVPGLPRPGGSKKAFFNRKTGRAIVTDAGGANTKHWRTSVQDFALKAMEPYSLFTGPLWLRITFWMPRPRCHYGSGKNADKIKDNAPVYPAKAPDATKLTRSTEDALTGIVWHDDSQVVEQTIMKRWSQNGKGPSATIAVGVMGDAI